MRVLEPHEDKGDILNYYIIPEADTKLGKGMWSGAWLWVRGLFNAVLTVPPVGCHRASCAGHYGSVTVCYDKHSGRKCAVKSVAKRRVRPESMHLGVARLDRAGAWRSVGACWFHFMMCCCYWVLWVWCLCLQPRHITMLKNEVAIMRVRAHAVTSLREHGYT